MGQNIVPTYLPARVLSERRWKPTLLLVSFSLFTQLMLVLQLTMRMVAVVPRHSVGKILKDEAIIET